MRAHLIVRLLLSYSGSKDSVKTNGNGFQPCDFEGTAGPPGTALYENSLSIAEVCGP